MNEETTLVRRRGVMTRAFVRAVGRLGLRHEQLAAATGLTLGDLVAFRAGAERLEPADPRWSDCVLLVRLCGLLERFAAGDPVAMRTWMLEYNDDLNGVPAGMLTCPREVEALADYLEECCRRALEIRVH